jgi:hypothetical protein
VALLPPAHSGGFGAGYALRRRQEANRARLACRRAEQPERGGSGRDSPNHGRAPHPAIGLVGWPMARYTHTGTT